MDNNQLLNKVTQQLKLASNASPTQAGQTEARPAGEDQLTAINQIFELFRFNYHNQFLKAFPDLASLNMAKRLWLHLLSDYSGTVIMKAAERTVKESSWLPGVHDVVARCDMAETLGMPSAHAAYMEACRAPSPKKEFNWSHPAVYFAGAASDWFFLANTPEQHAFAVFARNYEILLRRVQAGEKLELEIPQALPETIEIVPPRAEQLRRLRELKQALRS